jgi:hypothetical protein
MNSIFVEHQKNIEKSGLSIQLVGAESDGSMPSYAYTIGLKKHGFPDLYIVGAISPSTLVFILNNVFKQWTENGFSLGEIKGIIGGGLGLKLLPILDSSKIVVGVNRAYYTNFPNECLPESKLTSKNNNIDFVQVLWPDQNGFFPTDEKWDTKFLQPVYGSTLN